MVLRAVGARRSVESIVGCSASAVLQKPRVRPHVCIWAGGWACIGTYWALSSCKVGLFKALITEAVRGRIGTQVQ
eukprot:3039167-Rhodomonas_salina.1